MQQLQWPRGRTMPMYAHSYIYICRETVAQAKSHPALSDPSRAASVAVGELCLCTRTHIIYLQENSSTGKISPSSQRTFKSSLSGSGGTQPMRTFMYIMYVQENGSAGKISTSSKQTFKSSLSGSGGTHIHARKHLHRQNLTLL